MPAIPDRASLLNSANLILNKPGVFTKDDDAKCRQLISLADSLTSEESLRELRISKLKQMSAATGRPEPVFETGRTDQTDPRAHRQVAESEDFENYMRAGIPPPLRSPMRAGLGVGTGNGGGFLVPQSFADTFEIWLKQYDEIFDLATEWLSLDGSPSVYPILDDTGQAAAIVGEAGNSTEVDDVFAGLGFNQTPTWRSGVIRCSLELFQDSKWPLIPLTAAAAAVRFARGVGASFITTLLASAGLGVTTAAPTVIQPSDVFALVNSLDPAYSNFARASFLMLRTTYSSLLETVGAGSGNFMFNVNGARPTLLNYPVYFSPSMGPMTSAGKAISFGDHSKFVKRIVRGSLTVRVLNELYASQGQVGFESYLRIDGQLFKGVSIAAVNFLQMHA